MHQFYVHKKVYYIGFAAIVLFMGSFFIPVFYEIALVLLILLALLILLDGILLFSKKRGLTGQRIISNRLSLGDDNRIVLEIQNAFAFTVKCVLIDEIPFQFEDRAWKRNITLDSDAASSILYYLKPMERGDFHFGNLNIYASSPIGLVERRFILQQSETVKVYPSFLQMRRFSLLAISNQLPDTGTKRIRKIGHSMEFEQIKEYVRGDDYRTINWKATARNGNMMVNSFTDERSQHVFCIINKGRVMKMPFDGLSLLDYSINASLVLCSIALQKGDRAGLITYAETVDTFLPADKKESQMGKIQEALYQQKTTFLEPDNEKLFYRIRHRINQRSLLVLFTNFESVESLQRDLPLLKRMAHYHLLVVVFFENSELKSLIETKVKTTEDIYIKTIAEKYAQEKKLMVKELQKEGIVALLTPPQKLTAETINKYIELKNRQSI